MMLLCLQFVLATFNVCVVFVITDISHHTFFLFCFFPLHHLPLEWAPQHQLSTHSESVKNHPSACSSFIRAPPRNQSIKFNSHTPAFDQSAPTRGGLETVVRVGSSQSACRAACTKGARQRSLVAWMAHYSCPRWAYLRRHDGAM